MILTRDRGNRMWGGDGTSGGGGGGVSSSQLAGMLIGYATETWVDEHYISIDFFSRLFQAHGTENGSEIDVMPNDLETTITSVESMFGFWTNLYISALGSNGAAPAGISLGMLTDVNITGTPSAGQVLTFDAVSGKWVNDNAQAGTSSLSTLTDVLLSQVQNGDTLLYNSTTSKWYNSALKTINGQSLLGTGDITVGGGASGNYLPLSGGTLTGALHLPLLVNNWGLTLGDMYAHGAQFSVGLYNPNEANITECSVVANNENIIPFTYVLFNSSWGNASTKFCVYGNGNLLVNAFDTHEGGIVFREGINDGNLIYNMSIISTVSPSGYFDALSFNANGGLTFCTGGNTRNERMRIGSNGYVGIGTTSPQYILDVKGSTRINSSDDRYLRLYGTTGIWYLISFKDDGHFMGYYNNIGMFYMTDGIQVQGLIYSTGAITALSDARKKDITGEAGVTVEQIAHAPAVQFLWKDKERRKDGQQVGTLAQYWQTVLPEVVMDKGGELSMQYGVAALVSAIVTARKVVDHERRITELEKENERLKEEIEQLRLN